MPRSINEQIREQAESTKDWRHQGEAVEAYALFDKVNACFFKSKLPQVVFGFDDSAKPEGSYYFEGDSMSLTSHVDIPQDLGKKWMIVAVIHNAVHTEQELFGSKASWYHKKKFRDKLEGFGIKADATGETKELLPSFVDTLLAMGEGELAEEIKISLDPIGEVAFEEALDSWTEAQTDPFPDTSPSQPPWGEAIPLAVPEPTTTVSILDKPVKVNTSGNKIKKWVCHCSLETNGYKQTLGRFWTDPDITCNRCDGLFYEG